jgi:hypothetical protein
MALRRLALLVALLLTPIAAIAQQTTTFPTTATSSGGGSAAVPKVASGAITADDEVVQITTLDNESSITIDLDLSAMSVGEVYLEASVTGATWGFGASCTNVNNAGLAAINVTAGTVTTVVCDVGAFKGFRVRGTSGVTGSGTVALRATVGLASVPVRVLNSSLAISSVSLPVIVKLRDGANNAIASSDTDPVGTERGLIVRPIGPMVVAQPTGSNLHIVCDSGCGSPPATADGSAFTFGTTSVSPIGYVVDDTSTNTVTEDSFGAPRMTTGRIAYADFSKSASNTNSFKVDFGGAAQPVSGPLTDAQLRASAVPVSGTFWQATQPVSAAALPLPTGAATAAKQPALGTAGTPSADVISVQGVAGGTAQPVSGSVGVTNFPSTYGVTQSGAFTVTANLGTLNGAATEATLGAIKGQTDKFSFTGGTALWADIVSNSAGLATDAKLPTFGIAGTPSADVISVQGVVGGTAQPISAASLPLPTGAATSANQSTEITALQLIDNLPNTLGSTTSGQSGALALGAVTTGAPTYTTAQTNALSLTTTGLLRVDGSGVTQPVSGTVTTTPPANASTNVAQLAGTTTDTNSGTKSAGTLRVVLATDQPALTNKLLVTPDSVALPANQSVNVNQLAGTATAVNSGTKDAGTLRVVLATDQPSMTNAQPVNQTQVNGVTVSTGLGISGTGTQRLVMSQEATYSAGTTAKTATAAGTAPFFNICGSATTTVRVQRISVAGTVATAAVWGDIVIKKTSSAATGGTATTLTNAPYDSTSAAATATVKYFTVLPTAGTSVGVIFTATNLFPITVISATLQPTPIPIVYLWRDQDAEAPTLRGTAQCLEMNFGTTTTNAPTLTVSVAWTEK